MQPHEYKHKCIQTKNMINIMWKKQVAKLKGMDTFLFYLVLQIEGLEIKALLHCVSHRLQYLIRKEGTSLLHTTEVK